MTAKKQGKGAGMSFYATRHTEKSRNQVLNKLAPTLPPTARHAVAAGHRDGKPMRVTFEYYPDGSMKDFKVSETLADPDTGNLISRDGEILGAARERGRISAAAILARAEMLTTEQMAARLGLSTMSIGTKRKSHELLALIGASSRGHRYPEWQLDENDRPFAALPVIYDRLGGTEWSVYRYLTTVHAELDGMTGIEALRAGRDKEVIEVAESVVRSFA